MKTIVLLALMSLIVVAATYAEDTSLTGKWTSGGESASGGRGGASGGTGAASSAGCAFGPRGPGQRGNISGVLGPGGVCNDTGINLRRTPTELSLNVDPRNGALTGAIEFSSFPINFQGQGSRRCGKLRIEEGRVTGRAMAFTTYLDVNGARIPARWLGEVTDQGAIVLRTFDTLPCDAAQPAISALTGRPVLNAGSVSSAVLVYRRDAGSKKDNAAGLAGKWWTTDSDRLAALDLKVGSKGQVSGSVNVCGASKTKIEEGSVNGKTITFSTFNKVGNARVIQVWSGDLVNESTLRLSSPITNPCHFASSTTLVFQRSR
jgi:hypothetical protein